ncbi:hypothetical protein LCGC14_2338570 [marine sediment metagenome]|uniref:Uncharacterized protein n=1 Tax=marine sediment metagenome TaxID=412755 RepID=A0A0F9D086_9ZZZZ
MYQAREIVKRQNGEINSLISHIEHEIHINAIIQKKLSDCLLKVISQARSSQLLEIKIELQQALLEYNNNLKEE